MSVKIRQVILISTEMDARIRGALNAELCETFQQFVRTALGGELERRGREVSTYAPPIKGVVNVPPQIAATALQVAVHKPAPREGEPFPRRSDMVRDPNDGIPDFLRRKT